MKKLITILLAGVLALSVMLTFAGCGSGDYPVSVANLVIDSEPENIVVLDPVAADIIDYIGYEVKMVGRSDEVDQEWLSVAPSVGSAVSPDVNAIISSEADIVFATEELSDPSRQSLEDEGITVVTIAEASTQTQMETNYKTIGKILGGEETGVAKAEQAYSDLLDNMQQIMDSVDSARESDIPYEVCYLYMEDDMLKMMTSGTYGDMLLGYTGAVNIAVNVTDNAVEVSTLKVANPEYVFYGDEATLEYAKRNDTLNSLSAFKDNKTLMITPDQMSRQGRTAIETLQTMVDFMYPELAQVSGDSISQSDGSGDNSSSDVEETTEPEPSTTSAEDVKSVAEDYGIDIDDKLSLEYEDDSDDVKAMQQRLFDLGYVDDEENITGYYGDISKTAVKAFQKNSGIKETGTADNATLVALFSENAVKSEAEDSE